MYIITRKDSQPSVHPSQAARSKNLVDRREEPTGKDVKSLGRFVREASEKVEMTSPNVAGQYLQDHIYTEVFDQEEMWVLLLNSRCKVTHEVMVYRGTVNSALARPAELLKEAVRFNAPGLILAHNHPSADLTPSDADILLTQRVISAARLLDLKVYDHLIVSGESSWVTLRDHGLDFDQ